MPVASNAGTENTERANVPGDVASTSPSAQLPSAVVAPSTLIADNTATLASLRMVCLMAGWPLMPSLSLSHPYCISDWTLTDYKIYSFEYI